MNQERDIFTGLVNWSIKISENYFDVNVSPQETTTSKSPTPGRVLGSSAEKSFEGLTMVEFAILVTVAVLLIILILLASVALKMLRKKTKARHEKARKAGDDVVDA